MGSNLIGATNQKPLQRKGFCASRVWMESECSPGAMSHEPSVVRSTSEGAVASSWLWFASLAVTFAANRESCPAVTNPGACGPASGRSSVARGLVGADLPP